MKLCKRHNRITCEQAHNKGTYYVLHSPSKSSQVHWLYKVRAIQDSEASSHTTLI